MWMRMGLQLRTDDHVRGATGDVLIVYADFTCPYCALAHVRLTERERAVPTRRVFRHMALKAKHPRAQALAAAAEAAALQDAFWAFHDAVYADQGHIDDPHLWALAQRLGLDLDRFEADRRDPAVIARVEAQTREAVLAGAMTTPTLLRDGKPDQALYHALVRTRDDAKKDPLPNADQKG
jgi:protein-disulfide isomerase